MMAACRGWQTTCHHCYNRLVVIVDAIRIRLGHCASGCRQRCCSGPDGNADRPQPVPLHGSCDTFLDHSKQTFNGQPRASDAATQTARFTTTCAASGCVDHWLRVTALADNPDAPGLFDYHWVNDRWVSSGEYPSAAPLVWPLS